MVRALHQTAVFNAVILAYMHMIVHLEGYSFPITIYYRCKILFNNEAVAEIEFDINPQYKEVSEITLTCCPSVSHCT